MVLIPSQTAELYPWAREHRSDKDPACIPQTLSPQVKNKRSCSCSKVHMIIPTFCCFPIDLCGFLRRIRGLVIFLQFFCETKYYLFFSQIILGFSLGLLSITALSLYIRLKPLQHFLVLSRHDCCQGEAVVSTAVGRSSEPVSFVLLLWVCTPQDVVLPVGQWSTPQLSSQSLRCNSLSEVTHQLEDIQSAFISQPL